MRILLIFILLGQLAGFKSATPTPLDEERKRILNLLDQGFFSTLGNDFHRKMNSMVEKYFKKTMEDFFEDDNFQQFFRELDPHSVLEDDQIHWMETPKERILVLKMKLPKNSPLNINIDKDKIVIKGEMIKETMEERKGVVSKSISQSSFHRTYSVPEDCDGEKARFENQEGDILIRLPKFKQSSPVSTPRKSGGISTGITL